MPEIQVPDWVWKRAQQKFGMKIPATPLRDILTEVAANNFQFTLIAAEPITNVTSIDSRPTQPKARWIVLGFLPYDDSLQRAKSWFIDTQCGGDEQLALDCLEGKKAGGLKNAASWVNGQYRKYGKPA